MEKEETLKSKSPGKTKETLPLAVRNRALSMGDIGRLWLERLDETVAELEDLWQIRVGKPLEGGTCALAAVARPRTPGTDISYVIKIDMPEGIGHGAMDNSIRALKIADGCGYARLIRWDPLRRACLMERLGRPLAQLGFPVWRQIESLCETLEKSWQVPVDWQLWQAAGADIGIKVQESKNVNESIAWFREFLHPTWEMLGRPCPECVLARAYEYLQIREAADCPQDYVLVHGDAHSDNILEDLSAPGQFKFVDPDGIFYEKAYDLGVIMREWQEEYIKEPVAAGRRRCEFMQRLTGVDAEAIWQWGFLQSVSTGFVLLQIGKQQQGTQMLATAKAWCAWDDKVQ